MVEQQREVRHDLKNAVSALKLQLEDERRKPDVAILAAEQAQMREVLTRLAAAATATAETDVKLAEIHDLVNNTHEQALAQIVVLLDEIAVLKERLTKE